MDEPTKIPPPVKSTTDAMPVHMSYMRRDLDESKTNMIRGFDRLDKGIAEINHKLDNLSNSYVTTKDFEEHKDRSDDHEKRLRFLEERGWKVAGAAGVIAGLISIFGVFLIQFLVK